MKEIRLHGRGGQGAALASQMLANAFVASGQHAASFPMFGFERRGAPVVSFCRFDDKPVREKTQVYAPDCLMVLDPGLQKLPTLFSGLKPGSLLILNAPKAPKERPNENLKCTAVLNASAIAIAEVGRDIANTCLMGAFAAATGWLTMENLEKSFQWYFSGKLLENNMRSALRGFQEVNIIEW